MFAKITYKAFGSLFVKIVIIINNFGVCCSYFKIFGETANNLVKVLVTDHENYFYQNWHCHFYILLVFVVMSTLIFKNNLDSLKGASIIGVAGISIFFVSMIIMFLYNLFSNEILPYDSSILKPQGSLVEIICVLPTVFLAYTFQFNLFPIYFTLKKRTYDEVKKATNLAIYFCCFVYSIVGFIGYYMYRNNLVDTILSALSKQAEGKNSLFITLMLIVINISFLMSSTMSIPLMFFSLKNNVINSIIFCKKKFGKKRISADHENLLKTYEEEITKGEKNSNIENKYLSERVKKIIIVFLYLAIGTIAILVPELKIIFSIVGSTAANAISFILPNLFFIKLVNMGNLSYSKVIPSILLAIGTIIFFACLVGEIYHNFFEI